MVVSNVCGGVVFNGTIISMPKLFEERLAALTGAAGTERTGKALLTAAA
jgi:hypothetical protein